MVSGLLSGTSKLSAYDNVVIGKLKLKGKALDVKGGIKKKRNAAKAMSLINVFQVSKGGDAIDQFENVGDDKGEAGVFAHITPAERRYLEQAERLEAQRLAKMAKKSHRDRVQEFNQYLANLSEHYEIPKLALVNIPSAFAVFAENCVVILRIGSQNCFVKKSV